MSGPLLLSIQVGLPRSLGARGSPDVMDYPWSSGILKEPVEGPVRLGPANLAGDGQADTKNHGGPDKAVLAYSADHYPRWREELGLPGLPHGAFGENFTIRGLTEQTVCIGDTYAVGEARVQVSQPRQPCWKLARHFRIKDMAAQVQESGRTGWYLRVLQEGHVAAGVPVVLLERPCPEWTVARASLAMRHRKKRPEEAAGLARCPLLSADWRTTLSAIT